MAAEWRPVPFERLLSEPVRNGVYKPKPFHGRGAKIVNMGELFAYPRLRAVPMKRVELSRSETERFTLSKGDLLFARRSLVAEGAGKCSVVLDVDESTTFESSIIRARPDTAKAEPLFLYYFFNSPAGLHCLDTIRRQVAVAGITGSDLSRLEIPVPPLPEQRAIAHILGTLDDKVELTRRMNETLEAMARAIFKSWFVDFDPVRAKAEDRDSGLPKHIADLFPDRFDDSELGEIPNGWCCSYLGEVAGKIGSGATPRGGGSVYVADGVALIRSQNVYDSLFVWEGLARITDTAADALQGVAVEPEDVLLNITGASILRTCVVDPDVLPARVNQHVCIIRPKPEIPARYIHFHLLQPSTKRFLIGMDAGASRQAVTKGHIESVRLVIAPKPILDIFASLVGTLFRATSNSKSQSRSLASIRDVLLPKLISGELRVKDAERVIAGGSA